MSFAYSLKSFFKWLDSLKIYFADHISANTTMKNRVKSGDIRNQADRPQTLYPCGLGGNFA
jgi:hypothetical protein